MVRVFTIDCMTMITKVLVEKWFMHLMEAELCFGQHNVHRLGENDLFVIWTQCCYCETENKSKKRRKTNESENRS